MATHTPGRLHYQEKADVYTHILRTESGGHFVQLPQDRSGKAEADARRLAAAWNAAHDAGLSTEALEAGAVAKLVEACEHVVAEIEGHFSVAELVTSETLIGGFDDVLRAALTLAKGA